MTQLFGLSLLPLLGGFLFLRFFNLTKDRAYRYSGYKLLFYSAFWGLIGDLVSILLINFAKGLYKISNSYPNSVVSSLQNIDLSPYEPQSLLSFILLIISIVPLNLIFDEFSGYEYTIEALGTHLEKILFDAQKNVHLVSVTLKNRKVYVGYVISAGVSTFRPDNDRVTYLSLLPVLSGFREESNLSVSFTTEYYEMWTDEDLLKETGLSPQDFVMILPESEIASLNKFDYYVFQNFNSKEEESS